ncbi:hypothetical protein SAMN05518871_10114 [Psychrobacillus sp. OK028]|uniref:hypothetical protein n=1 Tax=Psychrobacillus sp. OK028 TaxID=1884359 RepID=UPI0008862FD7|nr:hypothetical protein [Psychrobacillus sp. OK028]SDM35213.1 hypothetical protein SAMN05518871_10114 [Psychrobacillus sp. OK028]
MSNYQKENYEELRSVVRQIGHLFEQKVEMHIEIFKPSIRKMIPIPFIFQKTDFNMLVEMGNDILNGIEKCQNRIEIIIAYENRQNNNITIDILNYLQVFHETQSKLLHIAHGLDEKARGIKLNYDTHRHLCNEYDKLNSILYGHGDLMNIISLKLNFLPIKSR